MLEKSLQKVQYRTYRYTLDSLDVQWEQNEYPDNHLILIESTQHYK